MALVYKATSCYSPQYSITRGSVDIYTVVWVDTQFGFAAGCPLFPDNENVEKWFQ